MVEFTPGEPKSSKEIGNRFLGDIFFSCKDSSVFSEKQRTVSPASFLFEESNSFIPPIVSFAFSGLLMSFFTYRKWETKEHCHVYIF